MPKIPNCFHFVFGLKPQDEPFHLVHYLCLASCIAVNKPEKVYFHYKYLPYGFWWDQIKDQLTLNQVSAENFVSNYNYADPEVAKYRYAHISDITRIEMLQQYGGIYADMDTLFVKPLPASFFEQDYIMGKERVDYNQVAAQIVGGSLCNAWIASAPGAAFGQLWLDKMKQEFDGTWSAHSTFLPYKLSQENKELIHTEPEESFYHFDWTRQGIQDIFENDAIVPEGMYSIHLWSHLWWSPKRINFTYFHEGNVTPEYIRYANTTFSKLAGPFLPAHVPSAPKKYARSQRFKQLNKARLYLNSKLK